MQVFYAPEPTPIAPDHELGLSIFLAGSIEMGVAEHWQDRMVERLAPYYAHCYNPRRPDFNPAWAQQKGDPEFTEQVVWELDHIEKADVIVFYFDPNTKSPVTMLELGLACLLNPTDTYVCCPPGFYRKGNVDITCERFGVPVYDSFDDVVGALIRRGRNV